MPAKKGKIQRQITMLRIILQKMCDGFDVKEANKRSVLTAKQKVLFLLSEQKEVAPSYLIEKLGIAKSNLALLCSGMVNEGLISVAKNQEDKRNITYSITSKGEREHATFLDDMDKELSEVIANDKEYRLLEKKLDEILEIFKRKF